MTAPHLYIRYVNECGWKPWHAFGTQRKQERAAAFEITLGASIGYMWNILRHWIEVGGADAKHQLAYVQMLLLYIESLSERCDPGVKWCFKRRRKGLHGVSWWAVYAWSEYAEKSVLTLSRHYKANPPWHMSLTCWLYVKSPSISWDVACWRPGSR